MSARPPARALIDFVLIDSHCHVHVLRNREPETGWTSRVACCKQTSGSGSNRNDSSKDVAGSRETISPLPEVMHITMSIKEDDWLGAIHFSAGPDAAADNLRKPAAGGVEHLSTDAHGTDDNGSSRADISPFYRFGLGLHPWNAHSRSETWLRDLTALLEEHPQALVGEIGLDKVARTPDTRRVEWDDQLAVFQTQMALAARLSRPVSVHCVKAYGMIVDYLKGVGRDGRAKNRRINAGGGSGGGDDSSSVRGCLDNTSDIDAGEAGGGGDSPGCGTERPPMAGDDSNTGTREQFLLPPRVALQREDRAATTPGCSLVFSSGSSFTGPVEVAKDITRIGKATGDGGPEVYFGFSAAVNMRGDRQTNRLIGVLRVVPDSRVLIETDRQAPATAAAEELLRVCGAIAEAKGISVEEAAVLANKNARHFLRERL